MIAEDLRLVVRAEVGNAIANLERVNKTAAKSKSTFSSFENQLMSFGKSLLTGAGVVMALRTTQRIITEMVKAAAEAEKSVARLSGALRASGDEVKENTFELTEYATALSQVTLAEDDAIIGAMSLLKSMGGLTTKGLKVVTPAVVDFAAAMGMDLEQAASLVAKAIGSDTNALGRYGIELKKGSTESEKLTQIVDQMTAKFGGMSAQLAGSGYGALIQYKKAVNEWKEAIGGVILEALKPLIDNMTSLLVVTLQNWSAHRNLTKALKGEASTVAEVDKAIKTQTTDIDTDITEREKLIKLVNLSRDQWQKEFGTMYAGRLTYEQWLAAQKSNITSLGERIKKGRDNIKTLEGERKEVAELNRVNAASVVIGEGLVKSQTALSSATKDYAANMDWIDRMLFNHSRLMDESVYLQDRYNKELLQGVELGKYQKNTYEQIIDLTDRQNMELLKGIDYTGKYGKAISQVTEKYNKMQDAASLAVDISSAFGSALVSLAKGGQDASEALKDFFKDAVASIIEMFAKQWLVMGLAELVPGITFNPVAGAGHLAAAAAASVAAGAIRAMGEGGVVTKPTMALVGEKGPEAVVPLNRAGGMVGGNITVIVNGSVMEEEGLARKIGSVIARQRRGY